MAVGGAGSPARRGMRRGSATWPTWLAALAALAGVCVFGWLATRVRDHERLELEHESEPRSLSQLMAASAPGALSARLAQVQLLQGERVIFELCADDPLEPALWSDAFELAIVELGASGDLTLMLHVKLDAARLATLRRNARGACLSLGGGEVSRAGAYSVDLVWAEARPQPGVLAVPLVVRVLAYRPPQSAERAGWLLLLGCVSALLALLLLRAPLALEAEPQAPLAPLSPRAPVAPHLPRAPGALEADPTALRRMGLSSLCVSVLLVAITELPAPGAFAALGKGAVLVVLQAGVPWLLAAWSGGQSVLPCTPRGSRLGAYAHALATCVALWGLARLALREIPATGEAPIQTFVAWPSGRLCFATLGLVLPLGEEAFFRGLLYRTLLDRSGRTWVAASASWLLFVALHAQQTWGNWGGLVAVAITGGVLTASRWFSGTVSVPALAHVLYNAALSAPTLW